MDRFIDVTIDPDGTIHVDMECYQGSNCEVDFKKISKILGQPVSQKKKQDYYQETKVQIKGENK